MELNQNNNDINIEMEPTTNDKIVRQNSLGHADAWIQTMYKDYKGDAQNYETIRNEYWIFAKECEVWVNRKK